MASDETENLELKKIAKEAKDPAECKRLLSKEGDEKKVKKVKSASVQRSMSSPASSPSRQPLIQRSISSQRR